MEILWHAREGGCALPLPAIRENLEALATLESHNIGKPIASARDEIELGSRIFEYYAGAINKAHGQTLPVVRRPGPDTQGAHGSGRRDRSMELPFPHCVLESGTCPRCRKHCSAQARIDFSSHGSGAGPACP